MPGLIKVVNPNSTEAISAQIKEGVGDLASGLGVEIKVLTCVTGPPAVESDQDVSEAAQAMLSMIENYPADAFVVACFSDPGIEELRSLLEVPVVGIGESSLLMAMSRGRKVGIISALEKAIPRHFRYWERLGFASRVVADLATGRGVLELGSEEAYSDGLRTGRDLCQAGADVVVLGCTGLVGLRGRLQDDLGVPVIEPCQAGVRLAAAALHDT